MPGSSAECNLNGEHIKAITSEYSPYFYLTSDNYKFINNLYHQASETYDVTDFAGGVSNDIIKIMALVCNFTYEIHIRRDGIFGKIAESNGSLITTGELDSVINGILFIQKYSLLIFNLSLKI